MATQQTQLFGGMDYVQYKEYRKEKAKDFYRRTGLTRKEYYEYKKQLAKEYYSPPAHTYTVDIPGMWDFVKMPVVSSRDPLLKRERYQRFKTHASPVPEWIQWVPGVINLLDDAQDLLYTGFYLAKPLLRRLPARFIPYVGWGLLVMDILNIATKLLGTTMTPGLTKPCIRKTINKYKNLKQLPLDVFRDWLSPGGWRRKLAFALQAPQASVTLTGYGLQLGALMGAVSETIWGGLRAAGGEKVIFRAPPPSDPAEKARRFVVQTHQLANMRDILTPYEHALIICAHNIAVGFMLEAGDTIPDDRANEVMDYQVPVFEPWELSTIEMFEELEDEDIVWIEPYTNIFNPTVSQIMDENLANWYDWELNMREVTRGEDENFWSVMYLIYLESSHDMIQHVTGVPWDSYTRDHDIFNSIYHLAGCDLMPWRMPTEEELAEFLSLALTMAEARGKRIISCEEWREAGKTIWGRMVSKEKYQG